MTIFGENEKIWKDRYLRLKKEYNWLLKNSNIMDNKARIKRLMYLESQIYYHKTILEEFKRKKSWF